MLAAVGFAQAGLAGAPGLTTGGLHLDDQGAHARQQLGAVG